MTFFPKKKYILKTSLSAEELKNKLRESTENISYNYSYNIFSKHKEFQSYIVNNSFEISGVGSRPSDFSLICFGEITETNEGCDIYIEIYLSNLVKNLSIILYILATVISVFLILQHIYESLFIIIAFPLIYIYNLGFFNSEIQPIERFLARLVKQ